MQTEVVKMKNINTIIWDFNGTILDDIDLCLFVLNSMLKKRNLPEKSLEEYREIFGFPIKEYYLKAGFDFGKEPYEDIAPEYIDLYFGNTQKYSVFEDFIKFQKEIKDKPLTQILLSATREDLLLNQLKELKIDGFFDHVIGTNDIFAHGKIERAKCYFKENNIDLKNAVLIGDTIHDSEVSKELSCPCVLYNKGHQCISRLKKTGCRVISSFNEILKGL